MHTLIFVAIFATFLTTLAYACPYNTLQGPDGRCYGFFPYGFNHTKSEYVCKNWYGGHLASIRDKKVEEFILVNARDTFFDDKDFWVGGRQEGGSGWSWTDKSSFKHSNWENDKPSSSDAYLGLVVNKKTGKWHSFDDNHILPYVCTVTHAKRSPF